MLKRILTVVAVILCLLQVVLAGSWILLPLFLAPQNPPGSEDPAELERVTAMLRDPDAPFDLDRRQALATLLESDQEMLRTYESGLQEALRDLPPTGAFLLLLPATLLLLLLRSRRRPAPKELP
ncbi:MAG: hypothetical protein RIC55_30105 [Pirellulaceae bacterium]